MLLSSDACGSFPFSCCCLWAIGGLASDAFSVSVYLRCFCRRCQAMDSGVINSDSIVNGSAQDSPSIAQVATEVNTYEDIVENSAPASGNLADYSQPELLIRTFQGQLDAMMVEHERMRQQLSALTSTLQTWQIQQQQTLALLRRIQEIMDPEFAPGEALHGLRLP